MSESGLSIGAADLRAEIGYFLGYSRTASNWSTGQLAEINAIMQSGIRRVYYPPAITQEISGYEWSWLRPTTTLEIESGISDYDLPDDFGRLVGCLYYPENEYRQPISIVSVGKILALRSYATKTGAPIYGAVRFKASDRTTGQRQEILLYPEPDQDWTDDDALKYEYEAYSGPLTDDYPYPLGGMKLAELYIESCLAVAESRMDENLGVHTPQYQALLVDAIARDRKNGPQIYGSMGDREVEGVEFRRGLTGQTYPILYKGELL